MTFEQIQKANESIRTMGIERTDKKTGETKVTQYAEVNQRIKAFRMVYPDGFIITDLVSNDNGVCVFKASVGYYENGDPRTLGTGTAYEKESSSFINKTSYIENCETSAVGRALGMAGFGIDTSVASYEEVANAIENQGKKKTKATKEQVNYILENSTQEQIIKIMDKYSIDDISDLDAETATKLVLRINKLKMEATK